ncbi:IclR family transcriptional regulator C-terminal domain-containing protein [Sinorhizobium sp. 8-89]|uniref:IclR family transcriptional regulator n=1 Tax=Sinorhizobium sp. 7-81 TaxID=3049087 RepID=UPI0024C3F276|nr:IclR family transcriptional regulator C-terminal domain-containing protein [Sinorhizobium sp. 7-81]MDK1389614.1 IclR family transcriptional regulator C-terminal domain-containing protein [Sinorhizobium sp. 7-81]
MLKSRNKGGGRQHSPRTFDNSQIDERLYLGTIEKGMVVLDAFYANPRPMTLTEVTAASGLSKSAAQRVLYTLRALRYLTQSEITRQYALSSRAMDIGNAYLRSNPLVEATFPFLLEASRQSQETVGLTELDSTDVVFISRVPSRRIVSSYVGVGTRLPALATASGRVILAYLNPKMADQIVETSDLSALVGPGVTDPSALLAELGKIRAKGFAVVSQKANLGDISTAAPVLGYDHEVVAAVTIVASPARWTVQKVEAELSPIAIETARQLSKVALHYRRP